MFRFHIHTLLLLIFFVLSTFVCTSSRPTPESITVITEKDNHSTNSTSHNFTRFLDAAKGSHVTGISELKNYLHRFGYLPRENNFSDIFDSDLESAISLYQKNLGLSVSGQLDSDTISVITSPRCGVSDTRRSTTNMNKGSWLGTEHYAYFAGKPRWVRRIPTTLTYSFSETYMISYLTEPEIKTVFYRAFSRWAAVIPINFTEIDDYKSADIKIGFYNGDHGDGEPFDGVLGVLAHAFSPENGRFHLDAAEIWAVDFKKEESKDAIDLESVATHEIGHVLGLAHSSVKESVMYPSLSPRSKKVELKIDDVEGVQALYGSNPNFSYSALLESEKSSNESVGLVTSSSLFNWLLTSSLVLYILFIYI